MSRLAFTPGHHSFYGCAHITIISGKVTVLGAELETGFSTDLFAPISGIPTEFFSESGFGMEFVPIPESVLTTDEIRLYYVRSCPDGFNQIAPCFFHSPVVRGAAFPESVVRFLDKLASGEPLKLFFGGPRGAGKSTLCRFAANRILNKHDSVVVVDLDIGQSGLSLPGTI